jgi:hypothetical protein
MALLMPRQFSLRSLFILTAIVAVGCLVGPPIAELAYDMGESAIILPFLLAGLLTAPILLLSIMAASACRAIAEIVPDIWYSRSRNRQARPPGQQRR